jgi:type IX secretion system PorP/SprF family membrane protein
MRAKRSIVLLWLLIFSGIVAHAQAPVFSQYYSSGLYLNPALSGLEKDIYLGMNYRSQWSNVNLPFNTFQFSFIHPLTKPGVHIKHLGGLGASFLNDVAGPNREFVTQNVLLSGAYNFHLNHYGNNILSAGLQFGATQQRVNYDALQWSTQYDPLAGFDRNLAGESGFNNQVMSPALNAGVMWYYTTRGRMSFRSTSVFSGLSVSNIVRPNGFMEDSKGVSSLLYKMHGGFSSLSKRKYEVSPNYLIQYQDHNFQVNVGSYVAYYLQPVTMRRSSKSRKVIFGAWYRLQDAFIFSSGFSTAAWNIGFSYDTNVSSFGRNLGSASAYEISLAYKIIIQKDFKRFSSPLI